jgi:hypothetical protein
MHEEIKSDLEQKYLKRFEIEFRSIIDEITTLSSAIPQFKDENAMLRDRINNIKKICLGVDNPDETILKIFRETKNIVKPTQNTELDKILSQTPVDLDEAMRGFDFYDNNPYKSKAEKKIAKIKKRNKK